MKIINSKNIKKTLAHGNVLRKKIINQSDVRSNIQTINDAYLLKGKSFEDDYHEDCEEIYYFLEGKGEMKINKKIFKVRKGDCIVIDAKENHGLKNKSSKVLRWISIRIII